MPRPLLRGLQIAVAGGLLALLWRVADGATALGHLAGARPAWLAGALAALTGQTLLSALRWRLTAERLGIRLDRRAAIREYFLAQLVNQALPGGVLGDAGRALRARAQAGLLASGQAVLFERLAGQIGLLAVFAPAAAWTLWVPGALVWPSWLLAPVALGLAGAGALLLLLHRAGPGLAGERTASLLRAFRHAVTAPAVRRRQTATSLATALCNIAAFACCAAAVGVVLPPASALVLVPLILLTMLVPITVSGWGLREGAAAVLLPLAGATAAEGLAASIAFGLAVAAAALPGLVAITVPEAPGRPHAAAAPDRRSP